MVSPSSSAQRARQALADRLREIRHDAELTTAALAGLTGIHRTKITKVENVQRQPSVGDIRAWCTACGAESEITDLLASLRTVESAYVEWRRVQRSGFKRLQESSRPLYERATTIRAYRSTLVSGIVQTPEYARAVLTTIAEHHGTRDTDIEAAVQVRIDRQRLVRDGSRTLVCVLEEAVLRHRVGDAEVMDGQLRHLLAAMSWPTTTLAVIPFTANRRNELPLESFFLWDDDVVRVELLSARVQIETPHELARYQKTFTALESMAVTGMAARRLINAVRRGR